MLVKIYTEDDAEVEFLREMLKVLPINKIELIEKSYTQDINDENRLLRLKKKKELAEINYAMRLRIEKELFPLYPRREGKTRGLNILQKSIKNDEMFERLKKAVYNFSAYHNKRNTEKQFIKHFSTFANCWYDYELDVDESEENNKKIYR